MKYVTRGAINNTSDYLQGTSIIPSIELFDIRIRQCHILFTCSIERHLSPCVADTYVQTCVHYKKLGRTGNITITLPTGYYNLIK